MTPPLVLVDGHNLLWRAAFGFPATIRSRDGTDRTGVFAFFALLRVALRELRDPAECVVCFDGEFGASRRVQADGDYKGNRKEIDVSPLAALHDIQRGLSLLGVPWVELDDEEADDVIASLLALDAGRAGYVMSTDRDFYQLVTDRVRVLNTALASGRRLVGPDHVRERYGVEPRQWCDFRALTGDPVDNIPGIRGVGQRTAARLLAGGLTLDTLRDSGRLTGRLGGSILDQWDQVLAWRDLVRLHDRVLVGMQPACRPCPSLPRAAEVLEELKLW